MHHEYLQYRPESGYKQPYLTGHNLRVGQLIYKMRANGLNDDEAAADMGLPLAQVREAQLYYSINSELVDQEAAEELQRLTAAGVQIESTKIIGRDG